MTLATSTEHLWAPEGGAGCRSELPTQGDLTQHGWDPRTWRSHTHISRFRGTCSMKRSGTALSFLLSEVSSGGCLVQAMEEGVPTPAYSETHRVVWRHSYRWENQGPERSVQVWGSIQVSSLRLQPLLLGARSQQGSGRRDHSGLDGRFLIAQGGHTFGAGPMAPFWEIEAGLKDSSK